MQYFQAISHNFSSRSVAKDADTEAPDPIRARLHLFARTYFEKPYLENMAAAAGVNYQQLTGYSSQKLPSGPVLERLRSRLGMSLEWFFGGVGSMTIGQETRPLSDRFEELVEELRQWEERGGAERQIPLEFRKADPEALQRRIIKLDPDPDAEIDETPEGRRQIDTDS